MYVRGLKLISAVYIKFLEECEGNISKTYYDELYSLVRFLIISDSNNNNNNNNVQLF